MKPVDRFRGLLGRASYAHGTRLRYMQGCKCVPCRAANSRYETHRLAARASGDWNGLVSPLKAIRHIRMLSEYGVGYKSVAKAAGVSKTCIAEFLFGGKTHIRQRTERKILRITRAAMPQTAFLPAKPFWALIHDLRKRFGFTYAEIAHRLGYKSPALQIQRDRITFRNARRIMHLHDSLTKPQVVAVTRGQVRSTLAYREVSA